MSRSSAGEGRRGAQRGPGEASQLHRLRLPALRGWRTQGWTLAEKPLALGLGFGADEARSPGVPASRSPLHRAADGAPGMMKG
jgi:hypothetical protein